MLSKQAHYLVKRALMASIAGGLLLGLVGVVIPKWYTSSTSLLFPGSSGTPGTVNPTPEDSGITSSTPPAGGGGSTDQPALPLLQGVLSVPQPGTSPGTAGLILKSRKTMEHLIRLHRLNEAWGLSFERTVDRFEDVFVCKTGTSGDLRIIYRDKSPERARKVVASAIDMLTKSVEELSLDPASKNRAFLRESYEQAEKDYRKAEKALVEFQRTAGGVPPDTQLQAYSQLYSDVEKELADAEVEASVAKSNVAKTSSVGEKMLKTSQDPTGSDKALLSILYQKLVDRESELALLRQKYTDKRPEVVQARLAVDVAQRKVNEEISRQASALASGASAFTNEAVLTAAKSSAKLEGLRDVEKMVSHKIRALPAAQAKYLQLQSDLRDERARLSLVRSEYVKAELIARSRGPQFVVMDPPDLPKRPNGYALITYVIVGLIIGPLLMLAKAFWLWLRQGIKLMSAGA